MTDTLSARYDSRTITLHWVTVVLVVALWGSAQVIDWFPKGAPRINAQGVHMLLGVILAVVLAWRLSWRLLGGTHLAPIGHPALAFAATWVHRLLYALLVAEVLLGFTNAWVRGSSIFNLFSIPSFAPGDRALVRQVNGYHEIVANTILVVAGLHALAGIAHHVLLKDDTLRRMLRRRA
jgi:cytochrome b561